MRVARRVASAVVVAACAVLPWTGQADERDGDRPAFTEKEIRIILSHGPWMSPSGKDPSNRVSGNREAIELGTRLFFDQRLSGTGTVSCSSCHVPERHWSDNRRRGVGLAEVDRNTPTVANLHGQRWSGWSGAADSLWSQGLRAIVDPRELAASPRHVADLIRTDADLSCRYQRAFGAAPAPVADEALFVDAGKAMAAFLETLTSGGTPFDRFRDALARGHAPSSTGYSDAALRGLKIFIGRGGCTSCHSGPNFTNGEFFGTGLSSFAPHGAPDPGRPDGIRQALESPFNLLGQYNDDPTRASGEHTRRATRERASPEEFKVPSLRNLMLTAPYGRDGSIETVAEVVRHYSGIDPLRLASRDWRTLERLDLSPREQTDLVVFLESLSTFTNPWRPDEGAPCQ